MTEDNAVCEHTHKELELKSWKRIVINLFVIVFLFFILRTYIAAQIANRGASFLSYGIYEKAIAKYKIGLFLNPRMSEIWDWLGYSYEQLGEKDKAIEIYDKAVAIDPNNRIAYHDAGMIYMKREDYKTAADYFLKASRVDLKYKISGLEDNFSFHKSALTMLLHCYEKLELIKEAIATNNEILQYYPDDKLAQETRNRFVKTIN